MLVQVEVKFLAHLQDELKIKQITLITENTLAEAIAEIERITGFPLKAKLGSSYGILVNGRSYQLWQKEKMVLQNGDLLAILPILGGG